MEHKSWLWKKKSTEKTMIAADKINRGNEDEVVYIIYITYKSRYDRIYEIIIRAHFMWLNLLLILRITNV